MRIAGTSCRALQAFRRGIAFITPKGSMRYHNPNNLLPIPKMAFSGHFSTERHIRGFLHQED